MVDHIKIHLQLGQVHKRILESLMKKTGRKRTDIIRDSIYRMGVEEGVVQDPARALRNVGKMSDTP